MTRGWGWGEEFGTWIHTSLRKNVRDHLALGLHPVYKKQSDLLRVTKPVHGKSKAETLVTNLLP